MPSEAFYREILKWQGVEYAAADAARRVYDYSPGLPPAANRIAGPLRGQKLEDLFDELAGSEEDLELVRGGKLPSVKIEKIGRRFPDGREGYLTVTVAPFPPGLLLIVTDVTAEGQLEQRVTQQRNELDLLAGQLAIARARLDDLLHRFVPSAVADHMIANPQAVRPGGERREVTILFADLRGFTGWAEAREPEEALEYLNRHFAMGIDAILAEGGTLDKIMGDALMGVFNAPHDQPDHALRAARAARTLLAVTPAGSALRFGIGINTGWAMAGNVGAERFMNYTVVGDAVNQAKRLQEMAQGGQVLVSETTYHRVQRQLKRARPLGTQILRGREKGVRIYDLADLEL